MLLFALFVVTAWFYSSLAKDSTEMVAQKHQEQLQMLTQVERVLSGTIGAAGNDGRGIAGVNWEVSLLPLKFLSDSGSVRSGNRVLINRSNT